MEIKIKELEKIIKYNFKKSSLLEKALTHKSLDNEINNEKLELDYSYDDFESMFKFNNPKAKSTCGCGTSFSVGM